MENQNTSVHENNSSCPPQGSYFLNPLDEVASLSPIAQFVHNQFCAFTLNGWFPCPGAKSAIRRGLYAFGVYAELGSSDSTDNLAHDLRHFTSKYLQDENVFTTFIASFVHPSIMDERDFEHLLWKQLQALHNKDKEDWCPTIPFDPDDAQFAFSFAGHPFFVVGLHASSSRWSRRFAWPTLIFNPHHQFEKLRETGKFEHFQQTVRENDHRLQGDINPNLVAYKGLSAARQYSGRFVEEKWICPFHH